VNQVRPAVDQPRVELYQRGAGGDFFSGIGGSEDAAGADECRLTPELVREHSQYPGSAIADRRSRESTGFFCVRQAIDPCARNRSVGGYHAFDAVAAHGLRDRGDVLLFEVWRDFQQQGNALAVTARKSLSLA